MELRIDIAADEPPEVVDELTARLRRELLELDVDRVDRRVGEAPPGSRGAMTDIATLLVQYGQAGVALTTIVGAVRGWLSARDRGTVKLEIDGDSIELPGGDLSPEQTRVVEAWLRRHER